MSFVMMQWEPIPIPQIFSLATQPIELLQSPQHPQMSMTVIQNEKNEIGFCFFHHWTLMICQQLQNQPEKNLLEFKKSPFK